MATTGSLYYQFGMGLVPCQLCWFQRIVMYPLVVVLGYAAITDFEDATLLASPFVVLGIVLSAYHSLIQLTGTSTCGTLACSRVQYRLAGALSIPNQALLAFLVVGVVLGVRWVRGRK